MKRKVFLCEDMHPQALSLLTTHCQITNDRHDLEQVEAIITRNLKIDARFAASCPMLKVVAIHGTGYDHVDVTALKKQGITVFHVPGENALSVAELTVGCILNLARKINEADRRLHQGEILLPGTQGLMGMEISHKVLGLIGCGHIARLTADILRLGFGMKVIAYSPSLNDEKASQWHLEKCHCPAEVFARANIVSIHCSLNEQTRHMVDYDMLSQAKKNCLVINTSRGDVIKEDDLYQALKEGIIKAAACDVFSEEPISQDHPLLTLDNFLATPHIGATTEEALKRVGMKTVQGILDYFAGFSVANRL